MTSGYVMLAFLRRAHRRRVIWRCAEGAGIGALVGAAAAAVRIAILAWRGGDNDALSACIVLLSLGALAGLLASIRRSPKLLDTAIDVDRQLAVPDLLSSALMLLNRTAFTDIAFANTVLAIADVRIRDATLSRLVARRLGGRAWGGIGLAIAGVLTIATMTASPSATSAAAERSDVDRARGASSLPRPTNESLGTPNAASLEARRAADREAGGSTPDETSEDSTRDIAPRDASGRRIAPAIVSAGAAGPTRGGDETRRERRDERVSPSPDESPDSPTSRNHEPRPGAELTDRAAGGVGPIATDTMRANASAGTVHPTSPSRAAPPAPPWRSSSWGDDRAAAIRSLESGAVPDRYRDLVRDYFTE